VASQPVTTDNVRNVRSLIPDVLETPDANTGSGEDSAFANGCSGELGRGICSHARLATNAATGRPNRIVVAVIPFPLPAASHGVPSEAAVKVPRVRLTLRLLLLRARGEAGDEGVNFAKDRCATPIPEFANPNEQARVI
jgi:hypothetical protein